MKGSGLYNDKLKARLHYAAIFMATIKAQILSRRLHPFERSISNDSKLPSTWSVPAKPVQTDICPFNSTRSVHPHKQGWPALSTYNECHEGWPAQSKGKLSLQGWTILSTYKCHEGWPAPSKGKLSLQGWTALNTYNAMKLKHQVCLNKHCNLDLVSLAIHPPVLGVPPSLVCPVVGERLHCVENPGRRSACTYLDGHQACS